MMGRSVGLTIGCAALCGVLLHTPPGRAAAGEPPAVATSPEPSGPRVLSIPSAALPAVWRGFWIASLM